MKSLLGFVIALSGFIVVFGLTGAGAEAKPVSGCPGGYTLMTVQSLEPPAYPCPTSDRRSGKR